jgi:hypothetical protein
MTKLTRRERRFLAAMLPDGTVATGTHVGQDLRARGLVSEVRWGRLGLTDAGREAISQYPESAWRNPSDASMKRRSPR